MIESAVRHERVTALEEVRGFGDGEVDLARDRQLVARCQSGDSQAFRDLYLLYYRRVYRSCLKRLRNPELAADATQETFAKAWKAISRFGNEQRFYPWLAVIAANHCTDVIRKQSRLRLVADVEDISQKRRVEWDPTEPDVQERVVESSERGYALAALGRLNPRHREVLQLREAQGLSYQAIADRQGVPVSAVETLIWRARQAFKREYEAIGGGAAAGLGLIWGVLRKIGSVPFHAARRVHGALVRIGGRIAGRAFGAASSIPDGAPGAPSSMTASSQALGKAALVALSMLVGLGAGLAGSGALGSHSGHAGATRVIQAAAPEKPASPGSVGQTAGSRAGEFQVARGRSVSRTTGAGPQAGTQGTQSGVLPDRSLGASVLGAAPSGVAGGVSQITGGVTKGVGKVLSGATGGVSDIAGGATGGLSKILSGATSGVSQVAGGVVNGASSALGGLLGGQGGGL